MNIIYDFFNKHNVMEAFIWANNFTFLLVLVGYPETIHNISHTQQRFLAYIQVYCISLVKTISTSWDCIHNFWFLSSCAKYTKTN